MCAKKKILQEINNDDIIHSIKNNNTYYIKSKL